jgi:hypothetical protein
MMDKQLCGHLQGSLKLLQWNLLVIVDEVHRLLRSPALSEPVFDGMPIVDDLVVWQGAEAQERRSKST